MAAALARVAQLAQDESDADGHMAELQTLAFIASELAQQTPTRSRGARGGRTRAANEWFGDEEDAEAHAESWTWPCAVRTRRVRSRAPWCPLICREQRLFRNATPAPAQAAAPPLAMELAQFAKRQRSGDGGRVQLAQTVQRICSDQVIIDLQSALKELIENALDARASKIDVLLKERVELLEVADNGKGIPVRAGTGWPPPPHFQARGV